MVKLERGDIVFDCGANLGLFSAIAAAKGCKVLAFEPIPDVIKELRTTAENNKAIFIYPYALSSKDGHLDIDYNSFTGSTIEEKRMESPDASKKIRIECKTLDSFVLDNEISRVDFIKADIEGAEREMLRGAIKIMRKFAPRLSICTYHLEDDKEVLEKIIKEANPNYIVEHKWKKLYAYVG